MNGMSCCGNVVVAVVLGDGERGGSTNITNHCYYYHHSHSESIYACNQLCQCHINIMTNSKQKKIQCIAIYSAVSISLTFPFGLTPSNDSQATNNDGPYNVITSTMTGAKKSMPTFSLNDIHSNSLI